jgi:glycosyltransferase involved in cell wall biosynthesis
MVFIGPVSPPQWGPAVRNRIMLDVLTGWGVNVLTINTLNWKKNIIINIYEVIQKSIKYKRVILSVSRNGRLILLPLLQILSIFLPIKVVFIPAGGAFADEVIALPSILRWILTKCAKRCTLLVVQRELVANKLRELGINNVIVLPNFKHSSCLENKSMKDNDIIKILFLSRVRQLKGIETLFLALDILYVKNIHFVFDIYGIVDKQYNNAFNEWLSKRPYATYRGVLEYNSVIPCISNYDIMVFPTLCETEGFPGVLADAALAGLAVVASKVSCNLEIITDKVNGLLSETENPKDLADKIEFLIKNKELRESLGMKNQEIGQKYEAQNVLKQLVYEMNKRGW